MERLLEEEAKELNTVPATQTNPASRSGLAQYDDDDEYVELCAVPPTNAGAQADAEDAGERPQDQPQDVAVIVNGKSQKQPLDLQIIFAAGQSQG